MASAAHSKAVKSLQETSAAKVLQSLRSSQSITREFLALRDDAQQVLLPHLLQDYEKLAGIERKFNAIPTADRHVHSNQPEASASAYRFPNIVYGDIDMEDDGDVGEDSDTQALDGSGVSESPDRPFLRRNHFLSNWEYARTHDARPLEFFSNEERVCDEGDLVVDEASERPSVRRCFEGDNKEMVGLAGTSTTRSPPRYSTTASQQSLA